MHILLNDRPGHPFEVELSRHLAQRGHTVQHCYGEFFQSPRGNLQKTADDPPNLEIIGIQLDKPFAKYAFFRRIFQEIKYSQLLVAQIQAFQPDIVIFANTPSEAMSLVYWRLRGRKIQLIFWVQDMYGVAINKILRKRLPVIGRFVGQLYLTLDRFLLRRSDQIILITEDFRPLLDEWGIAQAKTHVIPNWATLADLPVRSKANAWARAHQLSDKFCFLYSGTLGMKHNPNLLLELALAFQADENVQVLVISEGLGADWLAEQQIACSLNNLILLPYQPFSDMANVLGAADVLIAILEPDAGVFSVPSKVLSYLCAARPLLLAVPPENLAAKIVAQHEAGLVAAPENTAAFLQAAKQLHHDQALREQLGRNGRVYAETHFNIEKITDQFETIIRQMNHIKSDQYQEHKK
ncbi:MAG: glycosyltransferase family 4 protein [Anaerolineaceae bacterium]|nr:glycosyltransferase family 4 protein [Anaerolineaceae bacterium]